jgi:predicted nucleic acid-binding protein
MSLYVVDTSVVVKMYIPENLSSEAQQLFLDGHDLIAPDSMPSEFTNIIWKKTVLLNQLSESEGVSIIKQSQNLPIEYYSSLDLTDQAYTFSVQTGVPVYDGLFVSLAALFNVEMVTDDKKLANKLDGTSYQKHILLLEKYRSS